MLLVFFETLKMRNVQQIKVVGSHIWTGWFKSLILSSNTFIIIKSISSKKSKKNSKVKRIKKIPIRFMNEKRRETEHNQC